MTATSEKTENDAEEKDKEKEDDVTDRQMTHQLM